MTTSTTPNPPAAAAAATESTALTGDQQVDEYNAFSDAFGEITSAAPAVDETPPSDTSVADAAAAAIADSDLPPDTSGEQAAPVPAATSPEGGSPPATEPAPQRGQTPPADEDYKTKFEELNAQFEALRKQHEAPAAAPAAAAAPPPEAPPVYNKEETEFLAKYEEDWPDIARAEELKRRSEYNELVSHVFKEVARVYGPMVNEALQAANIVNDNAQLDGIRRVHSDYDAIYDDVVEWTKSLPAYIRGRAKEVMESGSVEDVNSMITDYKTAKGITPVAAAAETAPAPKPVETPKPVGVAQLSDAAKKAAKAMGAVDSKRTAGASSDDPNDFDGAWASINQAA